MSATKSERELLEGIATKLDLVLAFMAIRGIEGDVNAIVAKLNSMKFDYKIIAIAAGISENAASIRLSRIKKQPKKSDASSVDNSIDS